MCEFEKSIIFCVRFEDEGHEEGKDDGGRDACACGGERTCEGLEEAFFRAAHGAVGEKVAESRDGDGGARSRKGHEGLIEAEGGQGDPCEHEDDEDLSRRQVGEIDDDLGDHADEPSHGKRFYEHQKDLKVFHM